MAMRSGHHCTQPLHGELGEAPSLSLRILQSSRHRDEVWKLGFECTERKSSEPKSCPWVYRQSAPPPSPLSFSLSQGVTASARLSAYFYNTIASRSQRVCILEAADVMELQQSLSVRFGSRHFLHRCLLCISVGE